METVKGKRTFITSDEDYVECSCGWQEYLCTGKHKCDDCEEMTKAGFYICGKCDNKVLL